MAMCRKSKIKWASIITGAGAIIGGASTLIIELKNDEKELHKDEIIINDINAKILDLTKHSHNLVDDIKKTLSNIYKDVGNLSGKVSALESALNMIMRKYINEANDEATGGE